MNNNYQNMDPNTNLNDYLNGTQGQVNNQPVVNQNVNNQPSVNPNVNMGMNNVSNVNGMPMNQPPKKNNSMMILIIVVAVLLVGVGGFVVFKAFSNDGETGSGSTGSGTGVVDEGKGKEEEKKDEKIREYSEYKNYKLKMNITASYLGYTITAESNGSVDVLNNTDYLETKTEAAGDVSYSYTYDDYTTGVSYTSTDKVAWYSEETSGTESVNLDDLIEKINNKSDDVTVLGNGKYEVEMKVDETGAIPGSIPVEVQVTDGYITNLVYDLTSIYSSYGYSQYVLTMELSNFNVNGDVVIPANVKTSSSYDV